MKKTTLVALIGAVIWLSSCEKWLDVEPKSQVKEDVLFSSSKGFETALIGIYTKMATRDLYGANLTFGFLDVAAQYYTVESPQHSFYRTGIYEYDVSMAIPNAIWSNAYNVIVNCNNLLENIEDRRELFKYNAYELIKGEAIAVRAYLHFDLLRIFAPSYRMGKHAPGIPYLDNVQSFPATQSTVEETLLSIVADLREAEALLERTDPLSLAFESPFGADDELPNFFQFRRERLNYYAILGALARVYLYMDDHENARIYAEKALQRAQTGVLFTLFSSRSWDLSDLYFNSEAPTNSKLVFSPAKKQEIYETDLYGSLDLRYKDWFRFYPGSSEEYMAKYMRTVPQSGNPPNLILMRTEEMFYILAETAASQSEAVEYLNTVRSRFGIGGANALPENIPDLQSEILKEYRKTFIAEGQYFFYLKRINVPAIPFSAETDMRKAFVVPIPDLEIDFGNISSTL